MKKIIDCEKYADMIKKHLDEVYSGRNFNDNETTYFCEYSLDGFYTIREFDKETRRANKGFYMEIPLNKQFIRFCFASGAHKEFKMEA